MTKAVMPYEADGDGPQGGGAWMGKETPRVRKGALRIRRSGLDGALVGAELRGIGELNQGSTLSHARVTDGRPLLLCEVDARATGPFGVRVRERGQGLRFERLRVAGLVCAFATANLDPVRTKLTGTGWAGSADVGVPSSDEAV